MVGEVVRDTAESRPGLVLMIQQVPDGGFHGSVSQPSELYLLREKRIFGLLFSRILFVGFLNSFSFNIYYIILY